VPKPVSDDLTQVEIRLAAELRSREPRLETIATHLVGAGGKRLRPMVVSLVFHAVGGDPARRADAVEAAVALELIHSATLLHDDIIDGGETRRGRASALTTFGLADTLVAGDFLFCRAFALCSRFEAELIRWAAEACVALTEGEVMQGRFRRNPAVTVDDYLEIVQRKTASLFETGARTAARLGGADPALTDAMSACGFHVGRAFQMRDDLLDVTGDPRVTGKPRGIDLRDGNPSLPIVLAIARDATLRALFAQSDLRPDEVERGLGIISKSGVLAQVDARARDELRAARAGLSRLPASPYRDALEGLTDELEARIS
jgi:octaprenyl-diphosphate synthase